MVTDRKQFVYRHLQSSFACASCPLCINTKQFLQGFGSTGIPTTPAAVTLAQTQPSTSEMPSLLFPPHNTSLNSAPCVKFEYNGTAPLPSSGHHFSSHELYTALLPSLEGYMRLLKPARHMLAPPRYRPAFLSIWEEAQVFFISQVNRKFFTFQICIRESCF